VKARVSATRKKKADTLREGAAEKARVELRHVRVVLENRLVLLDLGHARTQLTNSPHEHNSRIRLTNSYLRHGRLIHNRHVTSPSTSAPKSGPETTVTQATTLLPQHPTPKPLHPKPQTAKDRYPMHGEVITSPSTTSPCNRHVTDT
jgi:hypothetical protein